MAALTGVRVVEFTNMITGPVAGCMLADLGADIVKIENPKGGDLFRTFRGGLYSPYFQSYNRNKRSLTLDLRSDKGREIAIDLVKRADILIENFRPGVMDRLGLGLEAMQKLNPKLIYCSITGFGADGPYKDRPAYDAVAQAISGLSSLFLNPEAPQITGPTISDNMTGIYACYGIMGALVERQRTGKGRLIEVNMLEATIAFFPDPWGNWTQLGIVPGPLMRVSASQSHALKCDLASSVSNALSNEPDSDETAAPAAALLRRELYERLHALIEALPDIERQLIQATYFEGRTLQDAADEFHISKSWASRLHAKSLQHLAVALRHIGLAD